MAVVAFEGETDVPNNVVFLTILDVVGVIEIVVIVVVVVTMVVVVRGIGVSQR